MQSFTHLPSTNEMEWTILNKPRLGFDGVFVIFIAKPRQRLIAELMRTFCWLSRLSVKANLYILGTRASTASQSSWCPVLGLTLQILCRKSLAALCQGIVLYGSGSKVWNPLKPALEEKRKGGFGLVFNFWAKPFYFMLSYNSLEQTACTIRAIHVARLA